MIGQGEKVKHGIGLVGRIYIGCLKRLREEDISQV
jgi:hypothetical protein